MISIKQFNEALDKMKLQGFQENTYVHAYAADSANSIAEKIQTKIHNE